MIRKTIFAGAAIAILVAAAIFTALQVTDLSFADLRREARVSLGLPKIWQTNFVEDVETRLPVECPRRDPLVIVTGGQSHAANALGRLLPFEPHRDNVTVYRGQCYATSNPVLGATGVAESLWTRFGNRLTEETGRPVVFVNGAVAGSQVSDWLDDRSGYRSRLVTTIRQARELGYEPDLAIWIQGETDAAVGIAPEQFATSLARLSAVIERESGMAETAPWMFLRSTFCRTMPENGPQLEAALERMTAGPDDRLVLGPSLTKFPVELRHDDCHLNGEGAALLIEDMVTSVDEIGLISRTGETG